MATGDASAVLCFLPVSDHLESYLQFLTPRTCNFKMYDVITENLTYKNFTEKKIQIDFKWFEMHKKPKPPTRWPVASPLKHVTTSYHRKFDQYLSINVALIHKRVWVP